MNFLIPSPDIFGFMLGEITDTGRVVNGNDNLVLVINQIRRGVANDKAKNLRCIPNIPNVKQKDVVTLHQLFGKSKRGPGKAENLKLIQEADRYRGKVDWQAKRGDIQRWLNAGMTLTVIANKLGVCRSTLSKANKRFNLYAPKIGPDETRKHAINRKHKSTTRNVA